MEAYEGPLMKMDSVNLYFSDSAQLKVNLRAKTQLVFENGDREFPEGFQLYFFKNKTDTQSYLTAQYGMHKAKENVYQAKNDVYIENIEKKEKLKTQEIFWSPVEQTIYTEKFVVIETPEQILKGKGLEAKQDFSLYTIKNPTGIINKTDF